MTMRQYTIKIVHETVKNAFHGRLSPLNQPRDDKTCVSWLIITNFKSLALQCDY